MSDLVPALYERDGALWTPSSWTGSPWSRTSQHGAAVNALFMCAAEEAAAKIGMHVARLTVDLLKPVPLEVLELSSVELRRGRRLAVHDMFLKRPADAEIVGSARAVLLASRNDAAPLQVPALSVPAGPDGIAGESLMPREYRDQAPPGFHWAVELRRTSIDGTPACWMEASIALAPGRPLTPLQHLAALADITFGVSVRMFLDSELRSSGAPVVPMINTDTTVHVEREPRGSWLAFCDGSISHRGGIGFARASIADVAGRVGVTSQTLLANL